MRFSTRTTYGLRAMAFLADSKKRGDGFVSLSKIAENEEISPAYLERIFAKLKSSGMVTAEKGKSGGYQLAKKPNEIDVFSLIQCLEGNISPFYCVLKNGKINCGHTGKCRARKVLLLIEKEMNKTLSAIKLSDIL
jgi:Rrf2 family transcriptional regulator, iron-sulfur cluster assembly transcription factor